jgi:hypothetical protein
LPERLVQVQPSGRKAGETCVLSSASAYARRAVGCAAMTAASQAIY